MAEFTIKTFDEKIHNIYIKGEVDEEMWQSLVDKINEIKSADDDIADQNLASLMSVGIEAQIIRPSINIYLCTYGGYLYDSAIDKCHWRYGELYRLCPGGLLYACQCRVSVVLADIVVLCQ